jgi:hypothetical protein
MFGGDSQKRTIINMLLSAALWNVAMIGVILGILRVTRDILGLLDFPYVVIVILFLNRTFKYALFFFYTLLTITRYLFIVVWKRMRGVEDKFWYAYLTTSTYLISLFIVCITIGCGITPQGPHFIKLYKELKQNETNIWR